MFSPKTIRIASVIALILSVAGWLISLLLWDQSGYAAVMGLLSWSILIWASVIGFRLSKYKLYQEEYKKVGIRIYLIILCFALFLFVGLVVGLVISVLLLSMLWSLKSNYDEWVPSEQEPPQEME